jgi:CRISPR-associated exonuclease Cas4
MGEEDPIALSALQHWAYCPRQCGLIHLEQAFDNNLHTLRGNALHALVDEVGSSAKSGVRVETALPLWHDEWALIGKADVVEFGPDGSAYPVEYKNGSRHKRADIAACDDLQLAAQALCLEAMTGLPVPEAAIYYAASKRRRVVPITAELRQAVRSTASQVSAMLASRHLPAPLEGERALQRCKACSLRDRCQPEVSDSPEFVRLANELFDPDAP